MLVGRPFFLHHKALFVLGTSVKFHDVSSKLDREVDIRLISVTVQCNPYMNHHQNKASSHEITWRASTGKKHDPSETTEKYSNYMDR